MKKYYILIVVGVSLQIHAQNSLEGNVRDYKTKNPIPNATVSIPDLHTSVTSNSLGCFTFSKIPTASYEVQISVLGYKAISKIIQINEVTKVNFELDKSSIELSEVVITGSSKATQIKKSPLPIIAINKEYLTTNLSTNSIDAIAKIPGVSTVSTGPNVSKPFIRGLGYNRIVTLFDGLKQEGQQWGDEHGIEVDNYLLDRIEIVKGPASLMYGSDALAGVINLIPNQPAADNKISGSALQEYQTNNGMYGTSFFMTGNKNGLEWGGRASKRLAKNFQNSVDGRVYNTGFNETSATAFVGLHKKWGFSHLNVSLFDDLQEIPDGSRDFITRKFTQQITESDFVRPIVSDEDLNSYKISVIHQRIQHYRFFLKNSFFFGASRLDANLGFQRSVRREFSHPELPYQEDAGLFLQLNTLNYDIKYYFPEYNKIALVAGLNGMNQINDVASGTEFVIPAYKQFDLGGFVTAKKDFGKLNVSGGLRFDNRNFNNDELYTKSNAVSGFDQATNANEIGAEKKFNKYATFFNGVSGSAGLAYILNTTYGLKLNFSRGYRAPNISEISANGVHPGTGFYQIGNDKFKPEFSNQVDLGGTYTTATVNAGVSLFVNKIENYIYNERLLGTNKTDSLSISGTHRYPTYKFKQGNVLLYGAEANIDFHIIKNLHFYNSMSLIYGNNNSFEGVEKNESNKYVQLMPPFKYISELRYDILEKSKTFATSFLKFEVQYTASQNRVYSYDNTETPTSGYTLMNLGAGTGLKNKNGTAVMNFYLLANNISDVSYQDHLSRLKYFEPYSASPNGRLGIYNMGRNISFKVVFPF